MIVDTAGMGLRAFLYKSASRRLGRTPLRRTTGVAPSYALTDALNIGTGEVAGLP
jgi:hypothetical protein